MARQHGHPIFYLTANFQRPEEGFDHQDAMPDVPGPDDGLTFAQIAELRIGRHEVGAEFAKEWAALDTRYLGNSAHPGHTHLAEDTDRPARAQVWVRVNGELGDDPVLHIAAFTYASDLTLLGATAGAARRRRSGRRS